MGKRIVAKKLKPKTQPLGGAKKPKKEYVQKNSNASTNPMRPKENKNQRTRSTIKRLNLYNEKRDEAKAHQRSAQPARVEPDRRWFGNTRSISQNELEKFRQTVKEMSNDPYSVLLKPKLLPRSLLEEHAKRQKLLDIEPYSNVFGPKSTRKRVKLNTYSIESYAEQTQEKHVTHIQTEENLRIKKEASLSKDYFFEPLTNAGGSKRIWGELYKVLDSSDVVMQILDARDPMGTRCQAVEKWIKKQPHRHMIFVLNKVDLIPTWCTKGWIKFLSKEKPTVAFRASQKHSFGRQSLFSLLRQFAKLHPEKKSISVGIVGCPNVGKSSLINTLKQKKVVNVAPIPGETKVWQYVTLTKRIYLIDSPGVVYRPDSSVDQVLKGAIRAEKLQEPYQYIPIMLDKLQEKKEQIKKIYDIDDWTDVEDFIEKVGRRYGKLKKGGDIDENGVAIIVINDWQRGKLPYFVPCPDAKQLKEVKQENNPADKLEEMQEEEQEEEKANE